MSNLVKSSVLTAIGVIGAVMAVQAILESKATSNSHKASPKAGQEEPPGGVSIPERPPDQGKKPWHHSTVTVTYPADSTMCDYPYSVPMSSKERPVIRAGALLKLIDIVAGIAARRHADGSCVTISLDNVLFLSPIQLGDLIHFSAAVNRSFTSSMEVGVRVMKEDPTEAGKLTYVSHAYLTFVHRKMDESPRKATSTLWDASRSLLWVSSDHNNGPGPSRSRDPACMPQLLPETPLQWRRYFLAGHRRLLRLAAAQRGEGEDGVSIQVRDEVRRCVMSMGSPQRGKPQAMEETVGSAVIERVELELLAHTIFSASDDTIGVNFTPDGFAEAYLKGEAGGQRVRQPLGRVRAVARQLGFLSGPGVSESIPASPANSSLRSRRSSVYPHLRLPAASGDVNISETHVRTIHIVFPEHANSKSILFGGQTMAWMEEAAIMSARHLVVVQSSPSTWRTVAMDGLEFRRPVNIGEVMTFTAIALRSFKSSCEVYVVASAESHTSDSAGANRRFTNDALFTLVYTAAHGVSEKSLRDVITEPDSALRTFAAAADRRKQRRLELREMLTRIYASDE